MSYSSTFFENHLRGSRQSADRIAAIVTDLVRPESVIDVGCGVGTWLAVFQELGAAEIAGLDGDYVDRELLQIPTDAYEAIDLDQWLGRGARYQPARTYDLAVCLEVAEHLAPHHSETLVRILTMLAPVVLFSAAIPMQGGTDHVNEHWQSFWAGLFRHHGFHPHDVIRPRVWDDPSVEPWYAQNALLYLREEAGDALTLDLVHPRLYVKNLTNATLAARMNRSLRSAFWALVRIARRVQIRLHGQQADIG